MGRHSAPAEITQNPQPELGQPLLKLGNLAVANVGSQESWPLDTERDNSGVVDISYSLLQPSTIQAIRDHYVARAGGLLPDIQNYDENDFTTARRANHMSVHRNSLILDTNEPHASQLVGSLKHGPRLDDQHFINRDWLLERATDISQAIILESNADGPFMNLPVRNFVFAEGFVSWQQGRGESVKKLDEHGDTVASANLLREYASRSTKAPPLEKVVGFIQPNGVVLYTTRQGSHRTAAAIQRGDDTIEVRTLSLLMLPHNVISLEEAQQPQVR